MTGIGPSAINKRVGFTRASRQDSGEIPEIDEIRAVMAQILATAWPPERSNLDSFSKPSRRHRFSPPRSSERPA